MKIARGIIYCLLLAHSPWVMADERLFLLPGLGSAEFSATTPESGRQTSTAYSLRGGMIFSPYWSGEIDWLSAHSTTIKLDSVALYLAHRQTLIENIFGKVRLGITRDRLDSRGFAAVTTEYGISGGFALGWKFTRMDVELDYTQLERDIQTITVHFSFFK